MKTAPLILATMTVLAGTSVAYWATHKQDRPDTPQNVRELCFAIDLELQGFKASIDHQVTDEYMRERELIWQGMTTLLDAIDDTCLLPEAHHSCLTMPRRRVREQGFSEHLESLIHSYQTGEPCR